MEALGEPDSLREGALRPTAVSLRASQLTLVTDRWDEDPLQWRWVHWRWKHRPEGSEEKYGREELRAAFPEVFASRGRHPESSAGEAERV